jgi:hypothetical protein
VIDLAHQIGHDRAWPSVASDKPAVWTSVNGGLSMNDIDRGRGVTAHGRYEPV